MSVARDLVRSLYSAPGRARGGREDLLGRAADAHADLLARAESHAGPGLARTLAPIGAYLHGHAPAAEKRQLLCHPLFIEGLHTLAPHSVDLQQWHDRVTASRHHPEPDPAAVASLGNVALELLLRADPSWCGRSDLYTDVLGRIGFPFCDWSLQLLSEPGLPYANQAVSLTLDPGRAEWRLDDGGRHPFLVMPRSDCVRMLAKNDAGIDGHGWVIPDPTVRPVLTFAPKLGRSVVRFDPVGIPAGSGHVGTTGALLTRILDAIRQDSPAVWQEFRTYIQTVRGFEFPRDRSVASFSDPTLPGVMGVSVAYTDRGEPCLDPFCFTWFGHEMGHTKDYLCDTVLYCRGESLVTNPGEWSDSISRYGRPLSVRTLIQVPYVHLYEWALLMDFCLADFHGLPWVVTDGAVAVGDDCEAEIEEAFDLIDRYADLTPIGVAAVKHFHRLYDDARDRWHAVRTLA